METTFVIIKPNGVKGGIVGEIIERYEKSRLSLSACKLKNLSKQEVEGFYAEHKDKGFFGELVAFMTSGPVVVQVLEGEGAIAKYRDVMGATDPKKAADGTIRKTHALSIGENSVHGSDAPETAAIEIAQFFSGNEIVG